MPPPDAPPPLGPYGLWTFALDVQPMARSQEAVAELESLGYGAVWVPEAVGREPFASSALLLSATRSMVVATGIASIQTRSALTMSAGWRTLSEAFPRRFLLGLGVSHAPMVEGVLGKTYDKPFSTMVAYLDAMDRGVFLAAPPSAEPQRALAALGPKMLALSATRAAGAHPYFVPVEHTEIARPLLDSAADEAGDGRRPLLMPEQAVVLSADPDLARQTARTFMKTYLRLPNYTNNLRRLGWSEEDITQGGGSDALVDAIVAWGDVGTVVERVRAHWDAGADHVCLQVLDPDPAALPMPQWRELAPALREAAPA